jgi:leucyl-tRNA synthetase
MNDCGHLDVREPFKALLSQGMVLHATYKDESGEFVYPDDCEKRGKELIHKETGLKVIVGPIEKMSKSKKNIVDVESMLKIYGADSLRMMTLSDSPPEKELEWTDAGLEGCHKFIGKLFNMADKLLDVSSFEEEKYKDHKLMALIHGAIKYVGEDIKAFALNKAIARARELYNALSDNKTDFPLVRYGFESLLQILNPFIPHVTEELWEKLGNKDILSDKAWPKYDEKYLIQSIVTLAIQVNGKLRATHDFDKGASKEELEEVALSMEAITRHTNGKSIKKVIIVPGKIVNIVAV